MRWLSLMVMALTLSGCLVPDSLKEHQSFLRDNVYDNPALPPQYLRHDGFQMHYRSNGQATDAVVLWVHGTPGSWADIGKLLVDEAFTRQVKLVTVDRPGWGESQWLDQPRLITDFNELSERFTPLLSQLKQQHPDVPLILAGHSWGGSVVPSIAQHNEGLVDGVLVFAGPLDPALSKPRWYHRAAKTWVVNRMIGDGLRAANVEMFALAPQLTNEAAKWSQMDTPVIVVQGDKDILVSPHNADYAEQVFKNVHVVRLQDYGHLLQIQHEDLIARCVLALAAATPNNCQG